MPSVIDFDAFRAEQTKNREEVLHTTVKIGGQEYPIAPSLPAVIVLDVLRMRAAEGDDVEISANMATKIGTSIFGEKNWEEILVKHQIGLEALPDLIRLALSAYVDDPKARAQILQTSGSLFESSTTGPSSKQTSSESTESISSEA